MLKIKTKCLVDIRPPELLLIQVFSAEVSSACQAMASAHVGGIQVEQYYLFYQRPLNSNTKFPSFCLKRSIENVEPLGSVL